MQLNFQFRLFVGFDSNALLHANTLLTRLNRVETWQMAEVAEMRTSADQSQTQASLFIFTRAMSEANRTIECCYGPSFDFSAEAERILEELHDLPAVQVQLVIANRYATFYPNFDGRRNFEIVAEMDQPFASETNQWQLRLQFDQLVERRNTDDEHRAYEPLSLSKVSSMFARHGLSLKSIRRSHDLAAGPDRKGEIITAEHIAPSQTDLENLAWHLATKTNLIKELAKHGRVMTIQLEKAIGHYGAEESTYYTDAQSGFGATTLSEVLLHLVAS